MRATLFLAVFFALAALSAAAGPGGVFSVVDDLSNFQTYSGGFSAVQGTSPSLEATRQALFLSSLFGARDQVNAEGVATFLQSLSNSDNGYGNSPSEGSDIASVRNAILTYANLGIPVPNPSTIGTFIDSCFDADTGLYAMTPGGEGTLKATALALESLDDLNLLSSKIDRLSAVTDYLVEEEKSAGGLRFFSQDTQENYYGIVAASYTDFEFGDDAGQWARFITSRQNPDGGFSATAERSQLSRAVDTSAAIDALYTLQKATGERGLVDSADSRAVGGFLTTLSGDLSSAAHGFKALARTRSFNEIFQNELQFEVADSAYPVVFDKIVSGSSVKPSFTIVTPWGSSHTGFDVTVNVKTGVKTVQEFKLVWNADANAYTASEFWNTGDFLGKVTFDTRVRLLVPDLGDDLAISFRADKKVGFDMKVTASAEKDGDAVEVGQTVSAGTSFTFDVALASVGNANLGSADFDVVFQVKDASLVVIDEKKTAAASTVSFSYTLKALSVPSGSLNFEVSIGSHTSERISYTVDVPMVASAITFSKKEYEIGDEIEITVQPATLVAGKPVALSGYDAKDKPANRRFFLNILSASTGDVVKTLPGNGDSDDDDKAISTFSLPVEAEIGALGEYTVKFTYTNSDGNNVELTNFNSALNEAYGEDEAVGYKVKADLEVRAVSKEDFSDIAELTYGNSFDFTFSVYDKLSEKYLAASREGTAALVLKNKDASGNSYVSTRTLATGGRPGETDPEFEVNVVINPNAEQGEGSFELVAMGGDGSDIAINTEAGATFSQKVTIGGTIDVEETIFTKSAMESRTNTMADVFLMTFQLSSAGEALSGAKLVASVTLNGAEILSAPVVQNMDEDGQAIPGYQTSWTLPRAAGGNYIVNFYREVDTKREGAKPFFTLDTSFEARSTTSLPVRTEFIVLVLLLGSFLTMSFKKMDLEGLRRRK